MKLGTHKTALATSLATADRVFVYQSPEVTWDVADAMLPLGSLATVQADLQKLVAALVAEARPGDHLVLMSNGSFGGCRTPPARLRARRIVPRAAIGPRRRPRRDRKFRCSSAPCFAVCCRCASSGALHRLVAPCGKFRRRGSADGRTGAGDGPRQRVTSRTRIVDFRASRTVGGHRGRASVDSDPRARGHGLNMAAGSGCP
jgi:hypothetical protein